MGGIVLQGIAPTLMIVRIGLGASVNSVEESIAAACSDHMIRSLETDVLRTPVEIATIDIRCQIRNDTGIRIVSQSGESVCEASAAEAWK